MFENDFTLLFIAIIKFFLDYFFKLLSRQMTSQSATIAREGMYLIIQKSRLQSKNLKLQNLLTLMMTSFKNLIKMKTCQIAVLDTQL
jgi:uncharacterized protein YsxB (DUF464 family)